MTATTPGRSDFDLLAPLASRYVDVDALEWKSTGTPGIDMKPLLVDPETGLLTALFRWAPGTQLALHEHVEIEQTYVLEGALEDDEGVVTAGNYSWRPAGSQPSTVRDRVPADRILPEAEPVLGRPARWERAYVIDGSFARLPRDEGHGWVTAAGRHLYPVSSPFGAGATTQDEPLSRTSDVFAAPVESWTKILCVGLNFPDHVVERRAAAPAHPLVFSRFPDSLVGAGERLQHPTNSTSYDYEGEIAVVIGTPAHRVAADDAMQHVFGLTCFNDGTVRDWQFRTSQYLAGKTFLASGSAGPWVIPIAQFADLDAVEFVTLLNGDVVQRARVQDATFSIPELVSYCSEFTELRPGDLIALGTPGGVGVSSVPPRFLQPGDTVEVRMDDVLTLRNEVG